MITYGTREFSNGKAILLMTDDHLELVFIGADNDVCGYHADAPLDVEGDDAYFRDLMAFSAAETFDPAQLHRWKPGNRHFGIYAVSREQ